MAQVVALVADLIFGSKITGTARALNIPLKTVRSMTMLQQVVQDAAKAPGPDGAVALVIIDLNAAGAEAPAGLAALEKVDPRPRTVAFCSHVDTELMEAARAAGADNVLPRSAFTAQLPRILREAVADS